MALNLGSHTVSRKGRHVSTEAVRSQPKLNIGRAVSERPAEPLYFDPKEQLDVAARSGAAPVFLLELAFISQEKQCCFS